jgi:hypothetical protein
MAKAGLEHGISCSPGLRRAPCIVVHPPPVNLMGPRLARCLRANACLASQPSFVRTKSSQNTCTSGCINLRACVCVRGNARVVVHTHSHCRGRLHANTSVRARTFEFDGVGDKSVIHLHPPIEIEDLVRRKAQYPMRRGSPHSTVPNSVSDGKPRTVMNVRVRRGRASPAPCGAGTRAPGMQRVCTWRASDTWKD